MKKVLNEYNHNFKIMQNKYIYDKMIEKNICLSNHDRFSKSDHNHEKWSRSFCDD